MRFDLSIAWRYLFSKKGHNAINIVSGVSAAAVCVVTAAMVCVLSVMNGFGNVIEGMFSNFDPDIQITAVNGKTFQTDTISAKLHDLPYIQTASASLSDMALVQYKEKQIPAILMGVDDNYQDITHIDSIIVDGYYSVYDGAFERAVMGRGLAATLGMNAHFVGGMKLYAPKRNAHIDMLRPDRSLNTASVFIAGTFAVNQTKYDDNVMLVSLPLARTLFDYDSTTVSALNISLDNNVSVTKAQRELRNLLGSDYAVLNRYEQQKDFYRVLHLEKLLTALLLCFILMIASFNIIGSLSMLIIDKKDDIRTLSALGANLALIKRIFLFEGWLISTLGAILGLLIGLAICLLQQHFGLLKLGSGTEYVISAYPVLVQWSDIILVGGIVILLGLVAAWIPVRRIAIETE